MASKKPAAEPAKAASAPRTGPAAAAASASSKKRVFLVDDHPIVRQGLAQLIGSEPDLAVIGQGEDAYASLKAMREARPDLALVDISLKDADGLELLKELKAQGAEFPVLILSMHDESLYAERALRAGARGYVMKQEPPDVLLGAIRRVLAGEIYVSDTMATRMVHKLINLRVPNVPSLLDSLSDREFQVFRMIADGVGPTEIANRLHVSVKTVETHREHIKEKLNLRSGAELRRFAMEWANDHR